MKRIYMLRHGQSEGNNTGIIQGRKDTSLTDLGIEQAKLVAERLKDIDIDKIYTSELSRAKDTADIIGKAKNIEVEVIPEFYELSFGLWEGVDFQIVKTKYKEDFELWKKSPHLFKKEGFEGLQAAKERMLRGLDKVREKDNHENILIVSHGSSLKSLLIGLLDLDNSIYKHLVMANTGLSLIEFGDYNNIIRFYNDYSHLNKPTHNL